MQGREGAGTEVASRQSGTRRNQNPRVLMSPLRIQAPLVHSPLAGHLLSLLLVPAHFSGVQLLQGQVGVPQRLGAAPPPPTQASGTLLSAGEATNEDTLTTRTEEQQRAGEAHVLPRKCGLSAGGGGVTQTRERALTPGNFLGFASSRVPPGTNLVPPRGLKQRPLLGGSGRAGGLASIWAVSKQDRE